MPAKAVTVIAVFEGKNVVVPPTTYSVTVWGGAGSSGDGDYEAGETVTISAGTAPADSLFKKWTASLGSGVAFANADSATTTFIMPAKDVTVTATFESIIAAPKTYAVTVSSAGTGAGGSGNYAAGDTVTVSAGTAPDGQQFKNWTGNGVTFANPNSATTKFVMPAKDVTVIAVFAGISGPVTYRVTVSSAGIGSSGTGDYAAGDTVKISTGIEPEGQRFKTWTSPSGSGVVFAHPDSATTTFIMPAKAVTVTAVFEPKVAMYKVTVSSVGNDPSATANYAAGAEVAIKAGTPPDGKQFKNWTSSDGVIFASASNSNTTFIMPAKEVTVTANFESKEITYKVTISSSAAGASPSGAGNYAAGATVSVSAGTVPAGQRFKNWTSPSGSGVTFANASSAATTFEMPAKDVTVTANFETLYVLTVTGGSGGGSYAANEMAAITAGTAPAGKEFKNWTSTNNEGTFTSANSSTTTFRMPAKAITVTANFETIVVKYEVMVYSSGKNNSGAGNYAAGDTVSIKAGTAPNGQRFKNWTSADGVVFAHADSANTTFKMPAKAVEVTAVFEATLYVLTVVGGTGGGSYAANETVNIRAGAAPTGKEFTNWTSTNNEGVFTNANSTITTFKMPAKAVTVTANYEFVVTDSRDGNKYKTTMIGGKVWMAENMNYETENSWCYGNLPDNCEKYGRLYDWATASTVCPVGWHLPSRGEWGDLAKTAGGTGPFGEEGVAGKKLKAKSDWSEAAGTDDFGFSALPGGYGISSTGFFEIGNRSHWWTSTESESEPDKAYYRRADAYNIESDEVYSDRLGEMANYKIREFSVRCIGD